MSKTGTTSVVLFVKRCLFLFCIVAAFSASAVIAANNEAAPAEARLFDKNTLYNFTVVHGKRCTASNAVREYTLYIPECSGHLPGPPYPTVVLIHGFLMSGKEHRNNAEYLAQRGFIVLTPNVSKFLWGDEKRTANVADLFDQITWFLKESKTANTNLSGLIDPGRFAIGGNSSGAAVCLELLAQAQKQNIPVKAMCFLDGVPWERTISKVSELKPVQLLSVRAEPSVCNEHARMLSFLQPLKFSYDDIMINGARHCDAENPTTMGCMCVCGLTNDKYRNLFARLLYLYLRDTLSAPRFEPEAKDFSEVVSDLQRNQQVVFQTASGAAAPH